MKKLLILVSLFILITSCRDTPVKFVEVPINPPQEIDYKTNLQEGRYLKDTDTLKIELLDTSLVTPYSFKDFFSYVGNVVPSKHDTENPVYEFIHLQLIEEINPDNEYEIWVYGFKPNLDSTKQKQIGRFLNYNVTTGNSLSDHHFINNEITFDVVSTTE